MATHSDPASAPAPTPPPKSTAASSAKLVEYEAFIEAQLRKTGGQVRSVDIAGSLMTLAAGTLAFVFLATMIDHWAVPGGLGFWGRSLLLAGFVVATLYYLVVHLLPLCLRRINPVYAAYTIERSRPSLKNALVNFLMFRAHPQDLTPVVYQAIEEQAATNLASVHVETAVDRSKLIRIGYALLGIVFLCAIYTLFSPKDLFKTVGRVAMPWAEINAPTRVAITEIEPGYVQAFRGQQVTVSAHVQGLPSDGKVTLLYNTLDGQIVDRGVEMNLPPDSYKYTCVLPASDGALQQSLEYRITAGDATSKRFQIEVVAAPTIVVRGVEYKYPSYTRLLPQRVEHQGDVKAIEGTEVTLDAVANQDIQSANIDFDCDGKLDLRMQAEGQTAKSTFQLRLQDDRHTPEHASYQLVFKNAQGQQNPQPVRHQIEITRDLPPEIQFVGPKKDEIDLPQNAAVDLEIVATDPDFALRLVKLSAAVSKKPIVDKNLLAEERRGQFVAKFRFEPRKLGLKAGDVVEYSALAEDNKDPHPNRTTTTPRRIRVVSPSQQPQGQDQLAHKGQGNDEQQPAGDGNPPGGDDDRPREGATKREQQGKGDKAAPEGKPADGTEAQQGGPENSNDSQPGQQPGEGEQTQGEGPSDKSTGQKKGEQGEPSGKSADGESAVPSDGSDDADAVERILKHRDEQNNSKQKPGGQSGSGQEKAGEGQQDPAKNQEQNGKNKDDASGQQTAGDKPQGQKPGDKANGKQSDPKQKPDSAPGGDEKQPGEQNGKADNNEAQADKQPGDKGQDGKQGQSSPKKQKPEKADRSQGPKGPQGAGESGQGDDAADDSQQGQQGQSGKQGQSSSGKGQKPQPGGGQDAADDDSAEQGSGSEKGKPSAQNKAGGDQQDSPEGDQAGSEQGRPKQDAGKPNAAKSGDKKADQTEERDGQAGEADPAGKSSDPKSGKKPERAEKGKSPSDQRSTDARNNGTPDKSDPAGDAKQGQGAQSKGEGSPDTNKKSSHDKQTPDAKGGDGENEKGESGAGQSGQDTKGSPTPMQPNQAQDKSKKSSDDDKDAKQDEAPQSPSNSKRESDSQGIDDGDRSGGGKKGGGQKADKSGTGGAGQNTAADEGAGRSDEAGKGETSDRAGSDREADKPTGQTGSQKGKGSSTRPSANDQRKPGEGKGSDSESAQSQSEPTSKPGEPSGSNSSQPGQSGGPPTGGKSNDGDSPNSPFKPSDNVAEEANLEYARKSTDLALEHLKDQLQKDHPDPELLKKLGWTEKDLQNFVRRWEQMRKQAQAPGEQGTAARQELDDALRSLGLRPRGSSVGGGAGRDDQSRGYKESRRTSPPPEYAPQYKAYKEGTSRAGK